MRVVRADAGRAQRPDDRDAVAPGVRDRDVELGLAQAATVAPSLGSQSVSGTTSGNLLSEPDDSATSVGIADTGWNSCRVRWQFLDGQTSRWLRLVTVGASGTPSPQVDLNQPISLRILLPPPGWSPPARAPILSLPSWQAGQFQFTLTGTPGSNYVIQVATNLTGSPWIPIRTNVAPFLFTDPYASNHHQRLYRAVAP